MSDTQTESRNKVTIEDAGPSRKKLSIVVPAEVVDEKIGESLETLAVEADLPGFRRGRAPRALIEKKFGTAIRREAKNQIVASAYQEAVEDNKLKVVGDPVADGMEDLELVDGSDLSFTVEVEVAPEFTMPALDGIEILKPTFEVTDELISGEIDKLCINEGDLESREEPEASDYLTGHGVMVGTPEGDSEPVTFHDIRGAVVQVPPKDREGGRGMILGVMVDDFAKQLGLPKPGETATIKVKGPENHEIEKIRGVDLTITFTVERVDRIIPAQVDTVVERFGFASADQLKEAIKVRLTQRVIVRQQTAMRQQLAKHLIDNTEIDLPKRLTEQQAQRTLDRRRMELMYRGVGAEEIESHMAELRAGSADVAARDLKLFFILLHAADDLEVTVSEAEINGRIVQLAQEQGVRPEKLRQDLIANNRVGAIYQQIREHKAMDAILKKAKIEEVSAEEFNKRLGAEAASASA